jgi:DNA polymerase V
MISKRPTHTPVPASTESTPRSQQYFVTRPAAGFPSPGDDVAEDALDINDLLIDHPEATFYVRVSGDSMEGAGIFHNDILVVDRSIEVHNGAIVVAAVYGELVVKRLRKQGSGFALVSENTAYEPILVDENDDCTIWGVVTGSVRMFR